MNMSVDQAHRLIGARLRDPQRRCQGRIVGVDQTRETPALWVVWENQPQAQRADLTPHDLQALVEACVAPNKPAGDEAGTESSTDADTQSPSVVTWRRTAGD